MPQETWLLPDLRQLRCVMNMAYQAPLPNNTSWYNLQNVLCVVWLIEAGYVDIRTADGLERIHAGNWVFQMPGLKLDQVFSDESAIISMRFSVTWPTGRSLFYSKKYVQVAGTRFSRLKKAALDFIAALPSAQTDSSLSPYPRPDYNRMAEGFVAQPDYLWTTEAARNTFLSEWYKSVTSLGFTAQGQHTGDRRVDRIVTILHEEMGCCTVPYQRIEEELNLSRVQVTRLCKRFLQRSPKDEHGGIRIERAFEKLIQNELSIKQIASSLGFKSASQFAKWFRRSNGRNPNEVRNHSYGPVV